MGRKRAVLVRQLTTGATPAPRTLWTWQKALLLFSQFTLYEENKSVSAGKGRNWQRWR